MPTVVVPEPLTTTHPPATTAVTHTASGKSKGHNYNVDYDMTSTPEAFFYPSTGKGFITFEATGESVNSCAKGPLKAILYFVLNGDGTARAGGERSGAVGSARCVTAAVSPPRSSNNGKLPIDANCRLTQTRRSPLRRRCALSAQMTSQIYSLAVPPYHNAGFDLQVRA